MHLVWHRAELRIDDHPALHAAAQMAAASNERVLPLVIIDPHIFQRADLTPRRQAWFLENVRELRAAYRARGSDLIVREGTPADVLSELAQTLRREGDPLTHAHFIRNYTPYAKKRDKAATEALESAGIEVLTYGGQYTHEPGWVTTESGGRYAVFSAYRRRWMQLPRPDLVPRPEKLPPVLASIPRGEIRRVAPGIELPPAGEAAARRRLKWFITNAEANYARERSQPALGGRTSKLSYYFNIGVLSPRLAVQCARTDKWLSELTWWDFFADVLDHRPDSAKQEFREDWRGFPWSYDESDIELWKNGRTGYPIVDAGMRELQQTGFMHNRVRMIAASFLVKHLLIDWRIGEEIFRGLLLCGDTSQNVGNWQWVAGCGVDAAPYFRIFNPVLQGKKFDPQGEYVRHWVPELKGVDPHKLHEPWTLPEPPRDYPSPMIDLTFGRERFLDVAKRHFSKN